MSDRKVDENDLVIRFASSEERTGFTQWLQSVGEQSYWESENGVPVVNFDYTQEEGVLYTSLREAPPEEKPPGWNVDSAWSRDDIRDGHYWFYNDFHNGGRCKKYARLKKLKKHYQPDMLALGPRNKNAMHVYGELVKKFAKKAAP